MAQRSPPHRGRALIVEDEILFALNLEAEMHTLGFDICDLAANGHQASTLAMSNVVLMDINLEGGREGIEVGRCLHTMYEAPVVFISGYTDRDTSSASTNKCRTRQYCPRGLIITFSPPPWPRLPLTSTNSMRFRVQRCNATPQTSHVY